MSRQQFRIWSTAYALPLASPSNMPPLELTPAYPAIAMAGPTSVSRAQGSVFARTTLLVTIVSCVQRISTAPARISPNLAFVSLPLGEFYLKVPFFSFIFSFSSHPDFILHALSNCCHPNAAAYICTPGTGCGSRPNRGWRCCRPPHSCGLGDRRTLFSSCSKEGDTPKCAERSHDGVSFQDEYVHCGNRAFERYGPDLDEHPDGYVPLPFLSRSCLPMAKMSSVPV